MRASAAARSASSTTPRTRPVAETTGRWRIPRSSMSSSASAPVRSADTVTAGAVMAAATGSSADMPSAITRVRRSRSVRIPSPSRRRRRRRTSPRPRSSAAPPSRIVVSGAQTTSGRRTSASHRLVGRVGRLLAGRAQAPAVQQRARQVAQRLGPSQRWRGRRRPGCADRSCRSCARAVKPVGRPDSIEACPKSSPTPSRSSVRPSRTSSTAPLRTTRRWLTGSAPCEKIVVPAGWCSSSAAAATRATSSSPSASNGG